MLPRGAGNWAVVGRHRPERVRCGWETNISRAASRLGMVYMSAIHLSEHASITVAGRKEKQVQLWRTIKSVILLLPKEATARTLYTQRIGKKRTKTYSIHDPNTPQAHHRPSTQYCLSPILLPHHCTRRDTHTYPSRTYHRSISCFDPHLTLAQ
jgi:hypothetical protein